MTNDDDDDSGAPYGNGADDKIVRQAKSRFERAREWESVARANFLDDMRFANGDSVNNYQWDGATRSSRGDRPCLTINKTRTHNLQIVNDARENKAAIRITPVGDGATYEAAQVFEGIVRHIEYQSQATLAYDTATYNQVYGGIGYWRVLTDYAHDDTMEQEIFIRRIADPMSVYLDFEGEQYDGSDAKWGFVFRDMTRAEFRAEYPKEADDNNDPAGLDPIGAGAIGNTDGWNDGKHVRVAEYYRVADKSDTLHRLSNGQTMRASSIPKGGMAALRAAGISIAESRAIAEPRIEWFLIAGHRVIDRKDWPGKFIPIVRVPCEEVVIDGKLDRVSHTRHLRDPQRLYNWYSSSAAEFVALQGKSPFIGTVEAVEGNKRDWETANVVNHAILTYKGTDDNGQPIPRPERAPPPVMAQAYMDGLKIAQSEMMMASGQYQAVMGQQSNETSGTAINARQRQGDRVTYHVIDHLASAIRYTGRILIDLIPKVYNTKRVMMILGEDGQTQEVQLDPDAPQAHQHVVRPARLPGDAQSPQGPQPITPEQADAAQADPNGPDVSVVFSPVIGRYSVESDVGPSYATKRQEAFNAFSQIMANNHEAFSIVGDFWASNADFPGADELAERLRRGLPPAYKPGPDPQVQQLQQAMQQSQAQAHALLGKADAEVASLKAQIVTLQEQAKDKSGKTDIDGYRAETDRLLAVAQADPAVAKVIYRSMLSQMLGMPALPVMQAHDAADAEHAQAMTPPDPGAPAAAELAQMSQASGMNGQAMNGQAQ